MAAMDDLRRVRFHLADPDLGTFGGWTDDTFWNGWLNVEVNAPTHFVISKFSGASPPTTALGGRRSTRQRTPIRRMRLACGKR